jgi:hypothetical protein
MHPSSIAIYRHQAKLAVGIPDGIVSIGFLKLYLRQWVKKPGDQEIIEWERRDLSETTALYR